MILKITNTLNKKQGITLFNSDAISEKENYGIPEGIIIELANPDELLPYTKYSEFCEDIVKAPFIASFKSLTGHILKFTELGEEHGEFVREDLKILAKLDFMFSIYVQLNELDVCEIDIQSLPKQAVSFVLSGASNK